MSSIVKLDQLAGLESVLVEGNLAKLSADQRISYYKQVCDSVGLNPLTQPFEYLTLQGKMILYARRACTDQLRHIHGISVTIVGREKLDGVYVVTARASTPTGRCDESIGAVPLDGLKGENLSNALMKAETKAKRRVTLAICGLSFIDESELDGVKDKLAPAPQPTRTLEAIATAPSPSQLAGTAGYRAAMAVDPTRDAEPADVQQILADRIDEYGLPIPAHPCPVVRKGKPDAGMLWSELPTAKVRDMYTKLKAAMSPEQIEWAEYLMMRDGASKEGK